MQAELKHPADELAKSLARAGGILTLLTGCYEQDSGSFATGNSFVNESLVAIEAILNQANEALGRLYQSCDLTMVRPSNASAVEAAPAVGQAPESEPVPATVESFVYVAPRAETTARVPSFAPQMTAGSYLSFFGPGDENAKLADRLDSLLVRPTASVADITERPAESYDELLQKLTAVADKAAFQAHQLPADRSLVPALEGLRADLIKLRSVA
jgi:hypothetical protein